MSPALFLLLGFLIALAAAWLGVLGFLLLAHWRFAAYLRFKGRAAPVRGWALVGYLWREAAAMLVVGGWHLAGRLPFARAALGHERPVVLVHGYTQNRTNFFGLGRRLAARGRLVIAPDLGTPLVGGIERYAGPLERALDEAVRRSPDGTLDVLAHSMGGLVLRLVLAARPDLAARVRVALTLGAPHAGTAGARGLARILDAGAMRRSSPLFSSLPCLVELVVNGRVVTMAAAQDYVVYPVDTCHLVGAECLTFARPGHTGLLLDPEVIGAVLAVLTPSSTGMAGPPQGV